MAGLQRTRRPMQMRPRSQLAAARGEGRLRDPARRLSHLGPGGPAARRGRSSVPGAAGAGCGGRAAQGAGGKLWRRPRGAVSAGAPGSPLYRESAPPPAPRARPPAARPPLPERAAAGRAPARRLCLARPLGRRAACAPGAQGRAAGRLGSSAAGLARRAGRAQAQVPLSADRLSSPGSRPLRGLRRRPAGSEARGRSGAECARRGGGTSARPTFRFGSGAGRAAPPLPSLRPPPLRPPVSPPPRAPPTRSARPARQASPSPAAP